MFNAETATTNNQKKKIHKSLVQLLKENQSRGKTPGSHHTEIKTAKAKELLPPNDKRERTATAITVRKGKESINE